MVRLLCGHFEELTTCPVDLVFMDPPDNEGRSYDNCRDKWTWGEYRHLLSLWLTKAQEVCKGPIFLSFAERWIPEVERILPLFSIPIIQRLWWRYTFGQSNSKRYAPCLRPIYWLNSPIIYPDAIKVPSARQEKYHDKRAARDGKLPDNVWEFSRVCGTFKERRPWHPTQHPEALMRRIILGHTKPGDTVLDPFIGSGTTAYVCEQEGRNCIGIDSSQFYLDQIEKELRKRENRRFEDHLDHASEVVSSWPKWKREVLGGAT